MLPAAGIALLVLGLAGLGCSGDDDLSFAGKRGEACEDCDNCTSVVNSCICETCTQYAFDEDAKELLTCTAGGVWAVERECPGGGSVACTEDGAYRVRCLDAQGNPVE